MIHRTMVATEAEVLQTLEAEAAKRGISLAEFAGEILAEKATELRRSRRPRIAVGHSGTGVAQDSVDNEDLPAAQ